MERKKRDLSHAVVSCRLCVNWPLIYCYCITATFFSELRPVSINSSSAMRSGRLVQIRGDSFRERLDRDSFEALYQDYL